MKDITVTEADIKNKKKEAIRSEDFLFRLLILLGAVRYNVSYDKFHGYRKTYKMRVWHPLIWIMIVLILIFSIPAMIFETLKDLKEEFKELRRDFKEIQKKIKSKGD